MKIALRVPTHGSSKPDVPVELVRHADRSGVHSVWAGETYGVDVFNPLVQIATFTNRIRLGTGIAQLAARPPATLAMQALSLDALAGGGRVIVGLGFSGPQIVEGWYGQPWGSPAGRMRDYVQILRQALDRKAPVAHDGKELQLPYRGPGSIGQGKPLKSIVHPMARIPIWIGTGGDLTTRICAEFADGWLPHGMEPDGLDRFESLLSAGFAARTDGVSFETFEIFQDVFVSITDDPEPALDELRRHTALYVGGMGSEALNFHRDAMARRGFADEAARIQQLWMEGRRDEAAAAVPAAYLDQTAFVGSEQHLRDRFASGAVCPGATGLIVSTTQIAVMDLLLEVFEQKI